MNKGDDWPTDSSKPHKDDDTDALKMEPSEYSGLAVHIENVPPMELWTEEKSIQSCKLTGANEDIIMENNPHCDSTVLASARAQTSPNQHGVDEGEYNDSAFSDHRPTKEKAQSHESPSKATTQVPSAIEPLERRDLEECNDIDVLLCRLIDLRGSIAQFYLEDSRHHQKRKIKLAELLEKCIFPERDERPAAIQRLLMMMNKDLKGKKIPDQLKEDLNQVIDMERQIAKLTSGGESDWLNLAEHEERLVIHAHVNEIRYKIRGLHADKDRLLEQW